MIQPFKIYKSSAGSGKTYTLTLEYLLLALSNKTLFRRILAVTFTNKATEEMKKRITENLYKISNNTIMSNDYSNTKKLIIKISEILNLTEDEVQKKAQETLSDILHNYGKFHVMTIDSFFYQIIRSFIFETNFQANFTVDLDTSTILEKVIDKILEDIGKNQNKLLRQWLTQYAEERVDEGNKWDMKNDYVKISKYILNESYRNVAPSISNIINDTQKLNKIRNSLNEQKNKFEKKIQSICEDVIQHLQSKGLVIDDFKSKANGPIGLFFKLNKLDFVISDKRRMARDNLDAWILKKSDKKIILEKYLIEYILPKYNELIEFFDANVVHYNSIVETRRYFYLFGILGYLSSYLDKYREENQVMLISDISDNLSELIGDSDVPYVFEKVGNQYNHFLVDEFQDTSIMQWNNLRPLIRNSVDQGNMCMIVGDLKQSIYRFKGGEWGLLQNIAKKDIGEELTITHNLLDNWRSSPIILGFNNYFFSRIKNILHEHFYDKKELISIENILDEFEDSSQRIPQQKTYDHEGYIEIKCITEKDKKKQIVLETIQKIEEFQILGFKLNQMAIVVRQDSEAKFLIKEFKNYVASGYSKPNLKYDLLSNEVSLLTSSQVIQFITSLMKWIINENDLISHTHWFLIYCREILKEKSTPNQIFINKSNWQSRVPREFVKKIFYLKTLPVYELVEEICRIFELGRLDTDVIYILSFQEVVLSFTKDESNDVSSFLEWWEGVKDKKSIIIDDEMEAIKIMTIHKSKGLEFPILIIPFLNWNLDSNNSSNAKNLIWVKSYDIRPFDQIPLIPIKYSDALKQTHWKDAYLQERNKKILDNINLLYVALTRPEKILIGFVEEPEKRASNAINVGHLMRQYIVQLPEWDEVEKKLKIGSLENFQPSMKNPEILKNQENEQTINLEQINHNQWRQKASLQLNHQKPILKFSVKKALSYGTEIHELLKKIRYKEELTNYRDNENFSVLKNVVDRLENYFSSSWKIRTEVSILLPNGEERRMDRLNQKDDYAVVIEYKTGSKNQQNNNQLNEYMKLLKDMGTPKVDGIILYVESMEIVKL